MKILLAIIVWMVEWVPDRVAAAFFDNVSALVQPVAYISRKTKQPVHWTGCFLGAEDGIRTRDLLLGKEMLYH